MRRTSRAALTLVEMLVAMAVTLIMMGAVVTIFGTMGNSVTANRAIIEISERLRNCRNTLQRDLGNITATMLPALRPENDSGYLEYVEGPGTDFWPTASWPGSPSPPTDTDVTTYFSPPPSAARILFGDGDDAVMFTARSRGEPYVGTISNAPAQSLTAEIVYYTASAPNAPTIINPDPAAPAAEKQLKLRTLYRRVLLVIPSGGSITPNAGETIHDYQNKHDLSVRWDGTNFIPNTLGDVTKRECRYGHDLSPFPFKANLNFITPFTASSGREGDDVILTNVLSFDVKAYDPAAPVMMSGTVAVTPSDPGYVASGVTQASLGCYVDLNYSRYLNPAAKAPAIAAGSHYLYNGSPLYTAQPPARQLPDATYDTWSMHYEANGVDEGSDGKEDWAYNGLDDDGNGVVDDAAEQECPPPYTTPLRGIQIKIRVYEPDSRQVREVTVVQDFMPQ